jgi:hypothetical protein
VSCVQTCRDCGSNFELTGAEIERFRDIAQREGGAWSLPTTCPRCRQAIRDARGDGVITADTSEEWYTLECHECGSAFSFGPRDVRFHAERGYRWPKRCQACRLGQRQWREANRISETSKAAGR